MIDTKEEQIKILCKQLKLPTFANYADILRQSQPGADFSDLLLELLMSETAARLHSAAHSGRWCGGPAAAVRFKQRPKLVSYIRFNHHGVVLCCPL